LKKKNELAYEDSFENATLKSFMDMQKPWQAALRRSSFWSCNGMSNFRKKFF